MLGVHLIVVNNTTHSNDFKDDNSDREELLCKPWNLMSALMQMLRCRFDTKHTKEFSRKRNADLTGHLQETRNVSNDDFFLAWRRLGGDVLWNLTIQLNDVEVGMQWVSINASDVQHVLLRKHSSGRLTSGKGYPAPACPSPLCAAGDQILSAVIRRDLAANACRSVAHERPRSEIVNKVTHTVTCTHTRRYAFPWQLKMADVRLMFCVLLVVLIAAPNNRWRSFFFRFQEVERPTGGTPKFAQGPLCLKEATLCLFSHINLVLSGFAHHKGDLGLSTFGCEHWSVVGEVAPPAPLGPGWKLKIQSWSLEVLLGLTSTPSLVD